MDDVRIILSGLRVALMLTYLWGDVLRIYAGDVTPGEIGGVQLTQTMLLVMAILMLLPIVMLFRARARTNDAILYGGSKLHS